MANFKRRPNKSGTVVKLSGKRSRPYMAKITTGYDDNNFGAQIQKPLGYYETRQEALDALSLYSLSQREDANEQMLQQVGGNLYNSIISFNTTTLPTFKEIYTIILNKDLAELTKSRIGAYNAAFNRLSKLHDKTINSITLFDMQDCVDYSKESVGSKVLVDMKILCTKIFKYAVMHQYIKRDQDYSEYINATKKEEKSTKHKTFTIEEIKLLIKDNSIESKMALIFIFTGARPIELLNIDTSNIFLNHDGIDYLKTGSKTKAGKNRIIPIHKFIKPFIAELIKEHPNYLLIPKMNDITNFYHLKYFAPLMEKLNLTHTPYDCRHTFATLAKLNKLDEFSRKKIMGHKAGNLTDDVYTHSFKEELYKEINKIKAP